MNQYFATIRCAKIILVFFLLFFGSESFSKSTNKKQIVRIPMDAKFNAADIAGLSGLFFEGYSAKNNPIFLTHTDRGPNGDTIETEKKSSLQRVFLNSKFQPKIFRFEYLQKENKIKFLTIIPLRSKDGSPITGLPNRAKTQNDLSAAEENRNSDEIPLNEKKEVLDFDPMGLDTEAITKSDDGHIWLAEEYRPSIIEFDSTGKLLHRYIPENNPEKFGEALLPAVLQHRKLNRGFESIAYSQGKIYAALQSPLEFCKKRCDEYKEQSTAIRMIEWDIASKKMSGFYFFLGNGKKKGNKIGDMVALGNKKFLIIEQNGKTGKKKASQNIYELNVNNATNLLESKEDKWEYSLEEMTTKERSALNLIPATKKLIYNLSKLGLWDIEKLEGLSRLKDGSLLLINDNDFSVTGNSKTELMIIPSP